MNASIYALRTKPFFYISFCRKLKCHRILCVSDIQNSEETIKTVMLNHSSLLS